MCLEKTKVMFIDCNCTSCGIQSQSLPKPAIPNPQSHEDFGILNAASHGSELRQHGHFNGSIARKSKQLPHSLVDTNLNVNISGILHSSMLHCLAGCCVCNMAPWITAAWPLYNQQSRPTLGQHGQFKGIMARQHGQSKGNMARQHGSMAYAGEFQKSHLDS